MTLTQTQINDLNRARKALEAIQAKHQETWPEGRLAEACEMASQAVFNVLNIANVFGITPIADDDLYLKGGSS